MAEQDSLRVALDQVVTELGDVPPYAWVSWLAYVLKSLEDKTTPDEYERVLQALGAHIAARLNKGHW